METVYFENSRRLCCCHRKVEITDTINQSIIRGNYAEIFKEKRLSHHYTKSLGHKHH